MLNRIETTIFVGQPARVVFGYLSRPENMSEWAGARDVRRDTPGRVRTGTEYIVDSKIGLKRVSMSVIVTDYQPHKQFAVRTELGPFSFYDRFLIEPIPGGSEVTQFTRVRSRGPFRLMVPLVTRLMRRGIGASLLRAGILMESLSGGR